MGKMSEYPLQSDPTAADMILGTRDTGSETITVNYSVGDLLEDYRIPALNAPTIPTEACEFGEIGLDANYVYFATGSGAWRRTPVNTWPHGLAYTITGLTGTRTLNLSTTYTIDDLAELLGQLISDLKTLKVIE
jgi:hypothetical protein